MEIDRGADVPLIARGEVIDSDCRDSVASSVQASILMGWVGCGGRKLLRVALLGSG